MRKRPSGPCHHMLCPEPQTKSQHELADIVANFDDIALLSEYQWLVLAIPEPNTTVTFALIRLEMQRTWTFWSVLPLMDPAGRAAAAIGAFLIRWLQANRAE